MDPWRKVVLWTVGGYIVLNAGFEMVRIPPVGAGIPLGELVLVCTLCVVNLLVVLPRMASETWLLPILVWWGMSLSRSLIDTTVGGAWSFRDASQAIESLYLIVGFWLVNQPEHLQAFFKWLRKLLLLLAFYGLLFPFSPTLQKYSPKLPGMASAHSASILFQVTNSPEMLLWAACWLLIDRQRSTHFRLTTTLWACLLVAFSIAFSQERTIYLEVLIVGVVLFVVRRKVATKWAMILLFGVVIIGIVSLSGLELKGRMGKKISLDFISKHFEAISGAAGSEDVEGAAGGVGQRLGWWSHIFSELKSSPTKAIFGLGYGITLTDFRGPFGIVREPHNSYISVLARLGLSGFIVWTLMQIALYSSWWRSYRLCRRMGWTVDQNQLLVLFVFCVLIAVIAIGEDGFEKPFNAIPYYLFLGVVLRYGRYLRMRAAGLEAALAG
jgi:O-antigen ligase